jgi:hypothetical protein
MQFVDAPKMSMNKKKNATAAVAVGFAWEVPDQMLGR